MPKDIKMMGHRHNIYSIVYQHFKEHLRVLAYL